MSFQNSEHENNRPFPICLICGEAITENEAVSCLKCHSPYHSVCWEYNEKCGTYGCGYTDCLKGLKLMSGCRVMVEDDGFMQGILSSFVGRLCDFFRLNRSAIGCFVISLLMSLWLFTGLDYVKTGHFYKKASYDFYPYQSYFYLVLTISSASIAALIVKRIKDNVDEAVKLYPLAIFTLALLLVVAKSHFHDMISGLFIVQFVVWTTFYLVGRFMLGVRSSILAMHVVWHYLLYRYTLLTYGHWKDDPSMLVLFFAVFTAATVWLPIDMTISRCRKAECESYRSKLAKCNEVVATG